MLQISGSFIASLLLLISWFLSSCTLIVAALPVDDDLQKSGTSTYLIGTGIYDITGPAAQVNMMGYARPDQTTHGIHQRLRARAFIMAEAEESVSDSREVNTHYDHSRLRWMKHSKEFKFSETSLRANPESAVFAL